MFSKLSALAIAASVLSAPVIAAPFDALLIPNGQFEGPLVLHRLDGTHRVTFVGTCAVEFDSAFIPTGTQGICDTDRMAIARKIVGADVPAPIVTGAVATRDVSPLVIYP